MTKLMKFTLVWCATWYGYDVTQLARAAYHWNKTGMWIGGVNAAIQAGLFIALLYMNRSAQRRAQRIKQMMEMMERL